VQLLKMVEPVHVDVHERRRGLVLAHDGEGRADDRLGDPEGARDPLRHHRLAGAELAVEQHDVTRAQELAESPPERVRLVRAAGRGVQAHGPLVTRANARLMTTKSARACASAGPPPRNTAD